GLAAVALRPVRRLVHARDPFRQRPGVQPRVLAVLRRPAPPAQPGRRRIQLLQRVRPAARAGSARRPLRTRLRILCRAVPHQLHDRQRPAALPDAYPDPPGRDGHRLCLPRRLAGEQRGVRAHEVAQFGRRAAVPRRLAGRERPAGAGVIERTAARRRAHVRIVHRPPPAGSARHRHPERSPGAGAADRLPRRPALTATRVARRGTWPGAGNKKPGSRNCRVRVGARGEGSRRLGDPLDQRRLADLATWAVAVSAAAWALAVAVSSCDLAIWAMASLVFTVLPKTSWPTLMLRSTFSRAICTPLGSRVLKPSKSRTSAASPKNEKAACAFSSSVASCRPKAFCAFSRVSWLMRAAVSAN